MVKTYRRKPETVQAVLYTGDNVEEVKAFLGISFISVNREGIISFVEGKRLEEDLLYKGEYVVKINDDCFSMFQGDLEEIYEEIEASNG